MVCFYLPTNHTEPDHSSTGPSTQPTSPDVTNSPFCFHSTCCLPVLFLPIPNNFQFPTHFSFKLKLLWKFLSCGLFKGRDLCLTRGYVSRACLGCDWHTSHSTNQSRKWTDDLGLGQWQEGPDGGLDGPTGSRQRLGWIPEITGGKKPRETGRPPQEKSDSRQAEILLLRGEAHREKREGAVWTEDPAADLRSKCRTLVPQQGERKAEPQPQRVIVPARGWCQSLRIGGRKEGSITQW